MKIQLSNIMHGLSEETNAFNADLLIDGNLVAKISNSGRGEANLYRYQNTTSGISAHKASDHFLTDKYEPIDLGHGLGTIPYNLDVYVDYLVERDLVGKQLWDKHSSQTNYICIIYPDNSFYEMKFSFPIADQLKTPANKKSFHELWKLRSKKVLSRNAIVLCPDIPDLNVGQSKKATTFSEFMSLWTENFKSSFTPVLRNSQR
jgi:hypothetical protein